MRLINFININTKKKGLRNCSRACFSVLMIVFVLLSCKNTSAKNEETRRSLHALLEKQNTDADTTFAIVNEIASNSLAEKDYEGTTLFLTDWVSTHPDDKYAPYWLLMTAHAYMSMNAEPIAEYYFDKIISEYNDLTVRGNSIHFLCLSNLIKISKTPKNRIKYFNELINSFPEQVSITEIYLRLALEYEKESEWENAMRMYSLFLERPDASTVQIAGAPDAYKNARQLVNFNASSKNWTFESLNALESAVRSAISNYDWRKLDSYRSKSNFFSISWSQSETDINAQNEFSMRNFMRGNRISVAPTIDSQSTPNEVYLRTWGWSQYVSVWYLCFRRVNFPINPEIHGNWEWAGIYMGERL